MGQSVIVVGSGVAGLSCALLLQEAGFEVEVWYERAAEDSTSAIAAAIWYPYKVEQDERVMRWALTALHVFRGLADVAESGVRLCPGVELFVGGRVATPWHRWLKPLCELGAEEVPAGYASGYACDLPVIEMPIYLAYLRRRLERSGGKLVQRALTELEPALAAAPLVIHCSGLGARELVKDHSMFPIRGHVLWVERGEIERFVLDDFNPNGPTYIVPRSEDVVLGGTADEGAEELVYDPAQAAEILARCVKLEPRLAEARWRAQRVGLRPGRPSVRLEQELRADGRRVIHNYGHGGAGVTLSWGCAEEVLELARGGAIEAR